MKKRTRGHGFANGHRNGEGGLKSHQQNRKARREAAADARLALEVASKSKTYDHRLRRAPR